MSDAYEEMPALIPPIESLGGEGAAGSVVFEIAACTYWHSLSVVHEDGSSISSILLLS